mgnify:CR=1 FL=1
MDVKVGLVSDIGKKRSINEDNLLVEKKLGIFMVADGMGGHAAGDLASTIAVETVHKFLEKHLSNQKIRLPFLVDEDFGFEGNVIIQALYTANQKIFEKAKKSENFKDMGTTAVLMLLKEDVLFISHVGDSRAYLFREEHLHQLTEDHSWVNEQLRLNQITPLEAKTHKWKNVIMRALGSKETVKVDINAYYLQENDIVLATTDGLTDIVPNSKIAAIIKQKGDDVQKCSEELLQAALENGGKDNITIILLKVVG